jgi:predicted PurR-regulated permease PerM
LHLNSAKARYCCLSNVWGNPNFHTQGISSQLAMEKGELRKHVLQFTVNIIGLLAFAVILFALYIFWPYIQPILLAAIISVPLSNFRRHWDQASSLPTKTKLHRLICSNFIIAVVALFGIWSKLFGVGKALVAWLFLIIGLACHPRFQTKAMVCVWVAGSAIFGASFVLAAASEVLCLGEKTFSTEYKTVILAGSMHLDKLFRFYLGSTMPEIAEKIIRLLDIDHSRHLSPNDNILDILNVIWEIYSTTSWNTILTKFTDRISSKHLGKIVKIITSVVGGCFVSAFAGADIIIQTLTFMTALSYFLSRKRNVLQYLARMTFLVRELEDFIMQVDSCLESITWNFLESILVEMSASYLIFTIFGSKMSAIWASITGLLIAFPIMHPSLAALLPFLEILLTLQRWDITILLIPVHIFFNAYFVAKVKIPFANDRGRLRPCPKVIGYFADIAIVVGVLTFGLKGILLGPLLAALPTIIYRNVTKYYKNMEGQ